MKKLILIICLLSLTNTPAFARQNQELNFDVEYQQATVQNSATAQFHLGFMYEQGIGVEQNYAKAV